MTIWIQKTRIFIRFFSYKCRNFFLIFKTECKIVLQFSSVIDRLKLTLSIPIEQIERLFESNWTSLTLNKNLDLFPILKQFFEGFKLLCRHLISLQWGLFVPFEWLRALRRSPISNWVHAKFASTDPTKDCYLWPQVRSLRCLLCRWLWESAEARLSARDQFSGLRWS